jgi:hypothetical protein
MAQSLLNVLRCGGMIGGARLNAEVYLTANGEP